MHTTDKANNTRDITIPWLPHILLNRKAKGALTRSFKNMMRGLFLALFITLRWKRQEHLVCIKRTVHSKTTSTDGTECPCVVLVEINFISDKVTTPTKTNKLHFPAAGNAQGLYICGFVSNAFNFIQYPLALRQTEYLSLWQPKV